MWRALLVVLLIVCAVLIARQIPGAVLRGYAPASQTDTSVQAQPGTSVVRPSQDVPNTAAQQDAASDEEDRRQVARADRVAAQVDARLVALVRAAERLQGRRVRPHSPTVPATRHKRRVAFSFPVSGISS